MGSGWKWKFTEQSKSVPLGSHLGGFLQLLVWRGCRKLPEPEDGGGGNKNVENIFERDFKSFLDLAVGWVLEKDCQVLCLGD